MKPQVFSQAHPLFISVFEATEWAFPLHRHAHYELVYILHGRGSHRINAHDYPYQAGDLFLFSPRDVHHFAIEEPTRFCVVKMNLGFLLDANPAFRQLQPFFERERFFSQPAFDAATRAYVEQQLHFCMREFAQPAAFSPNLIQASLFGVLGLLARDAMRQQVPGGEAQAPDNLVPALIRRIHARLKQPAALSTAALAAEFHLSAGYLGQYFRRHTGKGLKQFVHESRVRALQQELRYGDQTLAQLAYEYGFTDESHLAKSFKALVGETPSSYRSRFGPQTTP